MFRFIYIVCFTGFYFLINITASMAANPLGFEIGKASYDDVKTKLSSVVHFRNQGINKYSGGKMIVSDEPKSLGYNGLQKVTMIFDNKNLLTAVVMRLNRNDDDKPDAGFMYAYKRLSDKYLPVFKNIQTKGRMSAGFTTPSQDVHIRMVSARTAQNFDLQYLSDTFWKRYEEGQKPSDDMGQSAHYNGVAKESLF